MQAVEAFKSWQVISEEQFLKQHKQDRLGGQNRVLKTRI